MTALDCIASINPSAIYKRLSLILAVADKGSVITNDHAVSILIKLAAVKNLADESLAFLLERLRICATNQLPMYAENAIAVITGKHKKGFVEVLTSRLPEIEKESKRNRVLKVIKKLS